MYPFRYSSIFRSRWMALLWAAGILWTAYDFAAPDGESIKEGDAWHLVSFVLSLRKERR